MNNKTTAKLTEREKQIVRLIIEEKKQAVIADQLNIAVATVAVHIKHIKLKLRIDSIAGIVRVAIQDELV